VPEALRATAQPPGQACLVVSQLDSCCTCSQELLQVRGQPPCALSCTGASLRAPLRLQLAGACSLAVSTDAPDTVAQRTAHSSGLVGTKLSADPPAPRAGGAGGGRAQRQARAPGAAVSVGGVEAATAADAAFIDDEGAPPADEAEPAADTDSEDERGRAAGPAPDDEAEEEEDEFEKMFASKGRRRSGARAGASKADVDAFMGMMEAAAMTDLDANRGGKPAVHKLKMLAEAEDMLGRRGAPLAPARPPPAPASTGRRACDAPVLTSGRPGCPDLGGMQQEALADGDASAHHGTDAF
jgi:hypothetical protein